MHIIHGSNVTYTSASSNRQSPDRDAACLNAAISAWAVGSLSISTRLCPRLTICPATTITAPTGVSPRSAAARARRSASRICSSSAGVTRFRCVRVGFNHCFRRISISHASSVDRTPAVSRSARPPRSGSIVRSGVQYFVHRRSLNTLVRGKVSQQRASVVFELNGDVVDAFNKVVRHGLSVLGHLL